MDLANDMTKGTDNFPKTMVKTMQMLNDYKVSARQVQRQGQNTPEGGAFVQGVDKQSGRQWCDKRDHVSSECPHLQEAGKPEVGVDNLNVED
jgi:hypothetical protein